MKYVRRTSLTPAQERVAASLARGWTYARVGRELGISPQTVRNHVSNIVTRLPADFNPDIAMQRRVVLWHLSDHRPAA